MKKIACLCFLCLLLAGCATQKLPPVTEYALAPKMMSPQQPEQRVALTIKLSPIVASQTYMTPEFYYVDDSYQRNPYAYSRWVDASVRMLHLVLQDGLEQSGLFEAVLPPSSILSADLQLETTLYDFSHHVGTGSSSEAVVRMRFNLVDIRKGKILGSRQFVSHTPSAGRDAKSGVAAINTSVSEILEKLISWLAEAASGQ